MAFDAEACGTQSPRRDQSTPVSSWGALRTPREAATQAVRDGRDRPALIPISMIGCMLRWLLLGGRVGLGIVIRPLLRSASNLACLFFFSHVSTGLLVSLLIRFHRPPWSRHMQNGRPYSINTIKSNQNVHLDSNVQAQHVGHTCQTGQSQSCLACTSDVLSLNQ